MRLYFLLGLIVLVSYVIYKAQQNESFPSQASNDPFLDEQMMGVKAEHYNHGKLNWRITSETGQAFKTPKGRFEKLFLSENVTLLFFNDTSSPELKLNTSELWYYPDKQIIEFPNKVKTIYEKQP